MRSNFDVKQETNKIIQWIKDYFYENGGNGAVLGISGGKDSTIVAKLLVEAIGKDRVFGVFSAKRNCKLPWGIPSQTSRN